MRIESSYPDLDPEDPHRTLYEGFSAALLADDRVGDDADDELDDADPDLDAEDEDNDNEDDTEIEAGEDDEGDEEDEDDPDFDIGAA